MVHIEGRDIPGSPVYTMQDTKDRGWNLTHVEAKCRALLIIRLQTQCRSEGTITNWWLKRWKLNHPSANPPHLTRIPRHSEYLRLLAKDTAYIAPQGQTETSQKYRLRTYEVLRHLLRGETPHAKMRIETLWPRTDWERVWRNLWSAPVTGDTRATWYKIIHDIPKKERLSKIRTAPGDNCRWCGDTDTLRHRLLVCGEGRLQWGWVKGRVAATRRMDPKLIEDDCLLRPQFQLWPPRRRKAVLWTLAMYVTFRSGHERRSLGELREYIKEHLWELYQMKDRQTLVGNYLNLLLK
jgi:hypothetical protein